jgi:hypothetical protein
MRNWLFGLIFLGLCSFSVQRLLANENWPLTVKVLSTKNIEDEHGSFHLSWGGGSGGSSWTHRVNEHAFVEASDGNSYELQPKNPKDILLPGTYRAKIEKRDMKVCEPRDKGNCREVKFWIVEAVPSVQAAEPSSGAAAPTPRTGEPARDQGVNSPTGAQASLAVESTPPGADIEIDGDFVGNTPSTITLTLGSHKVTIKKKGFADWTRKMNLTGGQVHVSAELEPAPLQ